MYFAHSSIHSLSPTFAVDITSLRMRRYHIFQRKLRCTFFHTLVLWVHFIIPAFAFKLSEICKYSFPKSINFYKFAVDKKVNAHYLSFFISRDGGKKEQPEMVVCAKSRVWLVLPNQIRYYTPDEKHGVQFKLNCIFICEMETALMCFIILLVPTNQIRIYPYIFMKCGTKRQRQGGSEVDSITVKNDADGKGAFWKILHSYQHLSWRIWSIYFSLFSRHDGIPVTALIYEKSSCQVERSMPANSSGHHHQQRRRKWKY